MPIVAFKVETKEEKISLEEMTSQYTGPGVGYCVAHLLTQIRPTQQLFTFSFQRDG